MEIPGSGGTDQAPVTVLGIPSGGLGAYQFELRYDPAVVQVTDVLGGAIPFDGAPAAVNIDNTSGRKGPGWGWYSGMTSKRANRQSRRRKTWPTCSSNRQWTPLSDPAAR